MRTWYFEYLFEGANGPRFMTLFALDMQSAIKRFEQDMHTESGMDLRALAALSVKEVV